MKRSKISKISKVYSEDESGSTKGRGQSGTPQPQSGSNNNQDKGAGKVVLKKDGNSEKIEGDQDGGQDQPGQGQGQPGQTNTSQKRHKDLPDDYVETIEKGLGNPEDWDVGNVPQPGEVPSGEGEQGEPQLPSQEGDDPTADDIKRMKEAEKKIDEATREVLRERAKASTDTSDGKADGSAGYGKGGLRDRLHMEALSAIDWAQIFRTRMTKYSNDKFTRLPWNRQFTGNKMLRTRVTSKQPKKSQLPETNILIDTSGSISPWQAAIVMAEVKKALLTSKMKKLNVILWSDGPYWDKSYKKITEKDLAGVTKDIEDNWRSGGTQLVPVYKLMKEKGWKNKFTIIITDGYVYDRSSDEGRRVENDVLDYNNTVWAILLQSRSATSDMWESVTNDLSGEKVPVFLDTDKFRQR